MILVTGGLGYIGSHTCVELLQCGREVAVVDDLSNASADVAEKIAQITGKQVKFYPDTLLDKAAVERIFAENRIDSVIHFAGFKAVGESVEKPVAYYHNNLTGTLILLEAMERHGVKKLVFSSSATVYGPDNPAPMDESMPTSATNPYGWTKVMIEQILRDVCISDPAFSVVLLRYFNPVGAHESGLLGESPKGKPNNLMPFVAKVALGEYPKVQVFGNDYHTPDGTGVRDYIHVVDLAKGHLSALERIAVDTGVFTYNLGTGRGYSVLELIQAYGKAAGKEIPYQIVDRRPGDIGSCYASPKKAEAELHWKAEKNLDDMCRDSWRFVQRTKPQ